MNFCYPQPSFPNGVKIYVSQPSVNRQNGSSVINALQNRYLSSKADPNTTFEHNLKQFFNLPTACSVSNGYTGLYVILKSLKQLASLSLERNQIILPDATMVAVANSVIDNGLSPVLVDNQQDHLNPSAASFISKVTKNTLAIIVTHTYGVPVLDFDQLVDFCHRQNIYLIEDIAEAIGVKYKGMYLGTFGHFSSASLYANKLITCGDGGFIISRLQSLMSYQSLQEYWKCIINHGFSKNFHFNHIIQTGNYRINGLGAAFISNFNKYIQQFINKRKKIDRIYRSLLKLNQCYVLMKQNQQGPNTPWVFALTVRDKQTMMELRQHLANNGVQTRPFFKPIHTQPYIKAQGIFKNSQIQYQTGFYLPTYQQLTQQMQIYTCECLNGFFTKHKSIIRNFDKKPKRIIDLLSTQQIQEMVLNLTQQIRNKQSLILFSCNKKSLRDLGTAIRNQQIIQIDNHLIQKTIEIQTNKQKSIEKKIILRQHQLNFGKMINMAKQTIIYSQSFQECYRKYFYIQRKNQFMICWQKQYDKTLSIQQLPIIQIQENIKELSVLIAKQLFNFHQQSRKIQGLQMPENRQSLKLKLVDRIQKINSIFQKKIMPKQLGIRAIDLFNYIIQELQKNQQLEQKIQQNTVITHNLLTLQKIVWDQERNQVRIFDFQNISIEENLVDLAFLQTNYSYVRLNQLVINQYIILSKQNTDYAKRKIKKYRILKILNNMFKAISKQDDNAQIRQIIRKALDQIFLNLQFSVDKLLKDKYLQFCTKNYEEIFFNQKIEKKIKIPYKTIWQHHNGGWAYVERNIKDYLHSNFSDIHFYSAIQKSLYDCVIIEPLKQKWCGFIHSVPMNQSNCMTYLQYFLKNPTFMQSMKKCIGLYCLTQQIQETIASYFPQIPCEKIYYPLTPPKCFFNIQKVTKQQSVTLLHIGQYLRNIDFFIKTKVPKYLKKKVIPCGQIIYKNGDENNSIQWLQSSINPEQYESLMCESIIFFYLEGAGGCTTILQCISHNVPVVVNRLKSLQQYLGKEYPLFYQSPDQAEAIFSKQFKDKILATYYYLINMNKSKFYLQKSIERISKGYIYQMIKVPNQQKKQFQQYDISILLISYKRQGNIKKIVRLLSQQIYPSQKLQIIVWNNNPSYSLQFIQQEFKQNFGNIVVIQSSFNYYCYVRSAIASLARGKYLMFCDDDIFPNQHFVNQYMQCYQLASQQYRNSKIVTTLKGNVFHSFHNKYDIKFWTNYNNTRFIRPQDDQQEIDVIHMDTCLMKKSLMIQCASYQIPELDFILVDDYWYSFVLSNYLNSKIIKIKPKIKLFQECISSEDQNISLYRQTKVQNQKNRFFCYHSNLNWPIILSKDHFNQINNIQLDKIQTLSQKQKKKKEKCFEIYRKQFSGFNVSSAIWQKSIYSLIDLRCKVVRIGVVDIQKQFLNFYQKDGIHIVEENIIRAKLIKLSKLLQIFDMKYIITLGNIPGKNQYCKLSSQKHLWYSPTCFDQLLKLWRIIAKILSECPNCIGYDLINQPNSQNNLQTAELVKHYQKIIHVIREVDIQTPIILEPYQANYKQLGELINLVQQTNLEKDLIYSFHFYDPYVWTSARNKKNEDQYRYPGPIPEQSGFITNWSKNTQMWNKQLVDSIFNNIHNLITQFNLQEQQILLGEFGCRYDRNGIQQYFQDLLQSCRKFNINRLAYAYREQWWKYMNYQNNLSALKVILNDFQICNKQESFHNLLRKFVQKKSLDAQWLNYNPFGFEIEENQQKSSSKRPALHFDLQMQYDQSQNLSPVFIVGCGRSGTTFLLKCLSFAEQLLCLHQPLLLWLDLFKQFNIWSIQENQQLRANAQYYELHQQQVFKLKQIYSKIMNKTNKEIIVDKQPENVFKLQFLKKAFPNMKVIYIERDIKAVKKSIANFTPEEWYGKDNIKFEIIKRQALLSGIKVQGNYENNESRAQLQWNESKRAFQQFKSSKTQDYLSRHVIEISFQQLIKQTQSTLKLLSKFLIIKHKSILSILEGSAKLIIKKEV